MYGHATGHWVKDDCREHGTCLPTDVCFIYSHASIPAIQMSVLSIPTHQSLPYKCLFYLFHTSLSGKTFSRIDNCTSIADVYRTRKGNSQVNYPHVLCTNQLILNKINYKLRKQRLQTNLNIDE